MSATRPGSEANNTIVPVQGSAKFSIVVQRSIYFSFISYPNFERCIVAMNVEHYDDYN